MPTSGQRRELGPALRSLGCGVAARDAQDTSGMTDIKAPLLPLPTPATQRQREYAAPEQFQSLVIPLSMGCHTAEDRGDFLPGAGCSHVSSRNTWDCFFMKPSSRASGPLAKNAGSRRVVRQCLPGQDCTDDTPSRVKQLQRVTAASLWPPNTGWERPHRESTCASKPAHYGTPF